MLKVRASALEHGITPDQIEEVLANRWGMTKWFEIHNDAHGNSQDMIVGFDSEGNAIEVGVTYIGDDDVVFHADIMTPSWQIRYNEE